jgi:hypothetical protein
LVPVTKIVNIRYSPCDVYIGRGSPFGNAYVLGRDGDRQEVIRLYKIDFYFKIKNDPSFRANVEALRGKKLGCHCHPMPCHGDVIVEYLEQAPVV